MSRLRRGFSFFEVTIGLLLVVVFGMIAVPGVLMRVREQDEARAIRVLERIARAEHARRHSSDAAAYGTLPDLVESGALDAEEFDEPVARDFTRLGGYYFAILLPDADGRPVPFSTRERVDPENARKGFFAVAWPVRAGETGYGTYGVGPDLVLLETRDRDPAWTGPRIPDPAHHRILRSPGAAPPAPFVPLLPEITAPRMVQALVERGLPVPPALAKAAGEEPAGE